MNGSTVGKCIPSTFVWITPRIDCLDYCYKSPEFHQPDSSWYLKLQNTSYAWTSSIFLCRGDSGPPKTITYTIKIKGRNIDREITETKGFVRKHDTSMPVVRFEPPNSVTSLVNQGGRMFEDYEFQDNFGLFITCFIKSDTSHPVAGKEFVNSAVQTEVGSSLTEIENPKNEDCSSLSMKDVAVLSERMKELLIKGVGHDVTICVQDKEFRAHRSILSARSPVFAMMLAHDSKESNTGTINIEDCDPESFDEFLLYVYSGRTENLTPSNAIKLYYPADKYDFPELKERCVSLLKTSLSLESFCDVVLLATKHKEKELLDVATEFFARNIGKILVTVGWLKFLSQNPVEANELHIKSLKILHLEN